MSIKGIREKLVKYNTPRRIVQFLSFLFLSAALFDVATLPLLFPVLWTWGLGLPTAGDAFTAIQLGLTGWEVVNVSFPWLAFASFLVVGVLIGRSLCGWMCPFGLIQDLTGFIKRRQSDLSSRNHDTMIYIKYFILAVTLFITLVFSASKLTGSSGPYERSLGLFARAPFTALSPSEVLFSTLPKIVQGLRFSGFENLGSDILSGFSALSVLFWVQFAILISILVFAVYVPRGWCRYFCPHGAFLAVMNRFSFIGLRREPFKCEKGGCRECVQVCPTRVPILDLPWEKFSHPECIYCMKCADACEHKAIGLTYP